MNYSGDAINAGLHQRLSRRRNFQLLRDVITSYNENIRVNNQYMIEYIQKNFGDEYGMGHVKFKGEEFNIEETGEMGDYVRKLLGDAIDEDIESGREELRTTIRDYEAPINSWNL